MKILHFKDLSRKDGYIYYMRKFDGVIAIEIPGEELDINISFTIETSPLGTKNIELEIEDTVNYPIIPIRKAIIDFILEEDNEGNLPL